MSEVTKDFLHKVFQEIPPQQRVAFLKEVLETLDEDHIRALWPKALENTASESHPPKSDPFKPPPASAFGDEPEPSDTVTEPHEAHQPMNAAPSRPGWAAAGSTPQETVGPESALQEKPSELSPEALKGLTPAEIMKRVEAAAPVFDPPENEPEVNGPTEKQFQKIMFEHGEMGTSPGEMRRQFVSCMGLGVLVIAALTGLFVGGVHLFNWFKALLGF